MTLSKTTKPSEPEKVDASIQSLKHPLKEVAQALRRIILQASQEIGEEIKWSVTAFFYTGEMNVFNQKEFKRRLAVFNFVKKGLHSPGVPGRSESGRRYRLSPRELLGRLTARLLSHYGWGSIQRSATPERCSKTIGTSGQMMSEGGMREG